MPGALRIDVQNDRQDRLRHPASPSVRGAIFTEHTGTVNLSLQQGKGRSSGQLHIRRASHLVQLVMQQAGMPQADAEKRVDAAEHARKATLIAAFLAAATLAIGCAAACGAASLGRGRVIATRTPWSCSGVHAASGNRSPI